MIKYIHKKMEGYERAIGKLIEKNKYIKKNKWSLLINTMEKYCDQISDICLNHLSDSLKYISNSQAGESLDTASRASSTGEYLPPTGASLDTASRASSTGEYLPPPGEY